MHCVGVLAVCMSPVQWTGDMHTASTPTQCIRMHCVGVEAVSFTTCFQQVVKLGIQLDTCCVKLYAKRRILIYSGPGAVHVSFPLPWLGQGEADIVARRTVSFFARADWAKKVFFFSWGSEFRHALDTMRPWRKSPFLWNLMC